MATQQSWGYTNTTESEVVIHPTEILLKSDYGKVINQANTVVYSNDSAPMDQDEKISYYYRVLDEVKTDNYLANPGKVTKGFQFIVKDDAISRSVLDNGDVIDDPVVMFLTVRGSIDGLVTAEMLETQFKRLIGACYDFTNNKFKFAKLMRGSLEADND